MRQHNSNGDHTNNQQLRVPMPANVSRLKDATRIAEAIRAENASNSSSDGTFNPGEYDALLSSFRRRQGGFTVAESATIVHWAGRVGFNAAQRVSKTPADDINAPVLTFCEPPQVGRTSTDKQTQS